MDACLALINGGAVRLVLEAMAHYHTMEMMQEGGAGALWNLGALSAGAHMIVDGGGLKALLISMKNYRSCEDLAEQCCGALCSVLEALNSECRGLDAAARAQAERAGVTDIVGQAMERFPRNVTLREYGAKVLSAISSEGLAREKRRESTMKSRDRYGVDRIFKVGNATELGEACARVQEACA